MTPNPTSEDWPSIEAELDYSFWRLSIIKEMADDPKAAILRPQPDWIELTCEADALIERIDMLRPLSGK